MLPFSLVQISHRSLSSRTTAVTLHFGCAIVPTEGEPRSGIAMHRHTMWGIMPLINNAIQERAQNKILWVPNLTQEEVSVCCLLPWAALWRLKLNPQPWMKTFGLALSTLLGMKRQSFAAGEHWTNKTKNVSFAKVFKKKKIAWGGLYVGQLLPAPMLTKTLWLLRELKYQNLFVWHTLFKKWLQRLWIQGFLYRKCWHFISKLKCAILLFVCLRLRQVGTL